MENRAQALYWAELVELKVGCEYARRYRDSISAALTRFAVARAVVSVSALGAWITTNANPKLWAGVIVLVQVAEALQRAIPYAARFSGTNDLCASFDALFIEALLEWENIAARRIEADEITKGWGRLMTLRMEADRKALPQGLPPRAALMKPATADAQAYFKTMYPTEGLEHEPA
jgi:hypothetical protein